MQERFAVVFRIGESALATAGALEVDGVHLRLRGGSGADRQELEIPLADLSDVRVERRRGERLNGYPTLVLERLNLPPVQVAPVGMTLLAEIAGRVSAHA
ncbi:MAG: hypothetical protein ACRDLM_08765 [Gaiellaceae bacterium]